MNGIGKREALNCPRADNFENNDEDKTRKKEMRYYSLLLMDLQQNFQKQNNQDGNITHLTHPLSLPASSQGLPKT